MDTPNCKHGWVGKCGLPRSLQREKARVSRISVNSPNGPYIMKAHLSVVFITTKVTKITNYTTYIIRRKVVIY